MDHDDAAMPCKKCLWALAVSRSTVLKVLHLVYFFLKLSLIISVVPTAESKRNSPREPKYGYRETAGLRVCLDV